MMFKKYLVASLSLAIVLPVSLTAQAQPAVSTTARAVTQQLPTGPMTATTRAAVAVRASRAAQMDAVRGAGTAAGTASGRSTSIVGYLWTANNSSIPDATVQLRNTVTGRIELVAQTNAAGEFAFNNVAGGSYVIEYASEQAGSTLAALGHPFTVAPGQTVATFVRMSNALPILIPDVAGNIAASVVQAATSAGVTAVVTPIAPVVTPPPPPASSVR